MKNTSPAALPASDMAWIMLNEVMPSYKLRWFQRLTDYAQSILDSGVPAVLAGDFNVMPTELDVYAPERWVDGALVPAGGARGLSPPDRAGLDRRAAGAASR